MTQADVLRDAFGRIHQGVHQVLDGLSASQLDFRPDPEANSIAWLVWHLTRIQDDHVAGVAGTEQVWTAAGWHGRLALPFDAAETGYGHGTDQVAAVHVDDPELLAGYHDEVFEATGRFLATVGPEDLERVVDRAWDPPVTLGVRLVSVVADDLEHAGQAAYVRGLAERR